ncbi:MAG: hypothetical protein IJS46_04625 [Kiritimatiellae bacterium]|nr:hypothetical protein [Kiritimatiellia bacterium]
MFSKSKSILMFFPGGGSHPQDAFSGVRGNVVARGWAFFSAETVRAEDGSVLLHRSSRSARTVSALVEFLHPDGIVVWEDALLPDEVRETVGPGVPAVFVDCGSAPRPGRGCRYGRVRSDPESIAAIAALFRDRGIGVSDIFIGTPKWASPLRRLPGDLAALFRGCRDMAAAFGDTVEDWEFWNEPDIHFAPEPVWDFAAAQKAAYLGFKAARPEIPVAMAGLCQPPDGLYLKTLLANGVAPYFDIFNYHTYAPVSQYPSFFATMRKTLAEAGAGDRPIWITESGTNLEGPAALESVRPAFKAHSPDQELVVAEFFAKSQIAMQMAGMERNFAFLLGAYSERDGTKDWGLLRRDGTVKPAYAALATITHELGGATLAGALDVGPGARAYLYDHPDGTQTVAFWAESPIDTATAGHSVVEATPDFARELRLGTEGVARSPNPLRLVDLCGMEMPAPEPVADGTLLLPATRFPAYLSGLRGLCADVPGRGAPTARPKDSGRFVETPLPDGGRFVETPLPGPSPIVFRVALAPGDFDISNRKTLAIAKGAEPRLTVQTWNLSAAATTGTVAAAGAVLEGLPGAPVAIAPFEKAEFDCVLKPAPPGSPDASSTLVISGDFGGRSASPLAMPVLFENVFLASCAATPLDWKDPGAWLRNDSASSYSVRWDEPEQALRFDVAWDDPRVGRWFYPVLPLPAAGQNLDGAVRVAFEVKTAQDKVENDFGECCLMLVRGEKGGSPGEWLSYSPPTGSWERRYVELSAERDLHEVDAIRIGANPRGMKMTFWIRNIEIMKPAKPAATNAPTRSSPRAASRGCAGFAPPFRRIRTPSTPRGKNSTSGAPSPRQMHSSSRRRTSFPPVSCRTSSWERPTTPISTTPCAPSRAPANAPRRFSSSRTASPPTPKASP